MERDTLRVFQVCLERDRSTNEHAQQLNCWKKVWSHAKSNAGQLKEGKCEKTCRIFRIRHDELQV